MADVTLDIAQNPPIPHYLIRDVLAKLAYVDERVKAAEISAAGDLIHINLSSLVDHVEDRVLRDRVSMLIRQMTDGAFEPELRVIEEHKPAVRGGVDPLPELLASREVVQEGPGVFVLGPLLTQIVSYFESQMIAVAEQLGATAFRFPALISPRYLERVQYFKNFPHSLTFATHLCENLPKIQRFSEEARVDNGAICADSEMFAAPDAMLSPTVCHHLYLALSDTELDAAGLVATASGNCFRFESGNMNSLERIWNFSMREIIFVGSDDHVQSGLQEVRDRLRPLFEELGLAYKVITANDPFFIGTFRDQAAYQAAFELKFEIRASLPYKGDDLAVGSYNRHGDFFGRTLNIRMPDGSPACTGCVGIGFERLALAVVAQHGVNPGHWPEALRRSVAPPGRPFRFKSLSSDHYKWC